MTKDPGANPYNFAIGPDGQLLPHTPAEINAIVAEAMTTGSLLAAVFHIGNNLCVQVLGPPSRETAASLMQAAVSYNKMFQEQGPFRG